MLYATRVPTAFARLLLITTCQSSTHLVNVTQHSASCSFTFFIFVCANKHVSRTSIHPSAASVHAFSATACIDIVMFVTSSGQSWNCRSPSPLHESKKMFCSHPCGTTLLSYCMQCLDSCQLALQECMLCSSLAGELTSVDWKKKNTTSIHLDAKNINLISNTALISDFYQVNTIELSKDKKTVMHNLNHFSFFSSSTSVAYPGSTLGPPYSQNTSPRGTQAACWSDAQTPKLAALNVAPLLRAYPLRVRYGNEYSLAIL